MYILYTCNFGFGVLLILGGMCLVGIDGPAGTRREALFARARVKQRDCVVVIDTACAITQHLIGYIARFAMLA